MEVTRSDWNIRSAMKVTFAAVVATTLASAANATVVNNTSLAPPGVYFGSGNAGTNGHYAVSTVGAVELGLDVRKRGGPPVTPTGNVYNVPTGADPSNAARAWWNFDFSINLNANGTGTLNLGQVTPTLTVHDFMTGLTVNLNPLIAFGNDNSAWDGTTTRNGNVPGQQATATDLAAQNSENLTFGQFAGLLFDKNANDTFLITLSLISAAGAPLGSVSEYVVVGSGATPIPAALPLFASGLGVLAFAARHRKRKQTAAA